MAGKRKEGGKVRLYLSVRIVIVPTESSLDLANLDFLQNTESPLPGRVKGGEDQTEIGDSINRISNSVPNGKAELSPHISTVSRNYNKGSRYMFAGTKSIPWHLGNSYRTCNTIAPRPIS